MISADSITQVHPLFPVEGGGESPTSALQLTVRKINQRRAQSLNALWHSRLPRTDSSNIQRAKNKVFFGAEFKGRLFAIAIWTDPVARLLNGKDMLELRRLAISPTAPFNTASRLLGVMRKLVKKEFPSVTQLISYQDTDVHAGTIYKAAGWISTHTSNGDTWTGRKSRPRNREQSIAPKVRWLMPLHPFCHYSAPSGDSSGAEVNSTASLP